MRNIYVLVTRCGTAMSSLIHFATGDTYTHVSFAYDDSLESLCSFARLHRMFPFPGGLIREEIWQGHFSKYRNVFCVLLSLAVPESVYRKIRCRVDEMLRERSRYRYFYRGAVCCRLGMRSRRPDHYFCSQFVAELLCSSGALSLSKDPSLVRPQDFLQFPQFHRVYAGPIGWLYQILPVQIQTTT